MSSSSAPAPRGWRPREASRVDPAGACCLKRAIASAVACSRIPIAGIATPAELGAEFIHGAAPNGRARCLREAGSAAIDMGGEAWSSRARRAATRGKKFLSRRRAYSKARALAPRRRERRRSFCGASQPTATLRETALVRARLRRRIRSRRSGDWPAFARLPKRLERAWIPPARDRSAATRRSSNSFATTARRAGVAFALSTVVRRIVVGARRVSVDGDRLARRTRTLRARAAILTLAGRRSAPPRRRSRDRLRAGPSAPQSARRLRASRWDTL